MFDKDGSGSISAKEIKDVIKEFCRYSNNNKISYNMLANACNVDINSNSIINALDSILLGNIDYGITI